jgi:nucleotide-binding universal stress UspA family protein
MNRIVVGTDGSDHADRALHWAVTEAQLRGAAIELVHGYALHPRAAMFGRSDRQVAEALMDAVVERNRSLLERVEWDATVVPLLGGAATALLDIGEDAELIVVGSRGLDGFAGLFVGATSYRTAAQASAPVAVIRDGGDARDGTRAVVVGVDGSRGSRRALRWALDEAEWRGVGLVVVYGYVVSPHPALATVGTGEQLEHMRLVAHDDAVAVVDDVLDDVDVPGKVEMERVITAGSPAGVLLDNAGPDRLLVVGTRGRGALGRVVFGSVSHQCLHHAAGPVVVVP